MVYDCFQFFNELDILKIRLNVLSPVVDKFVLSEATETFSGLKKPLYYEENKELFSEFADKIIHVVVEDTPEGDTHYRDTFQKNAVVRVALGCILNNDMDDLVRKFRKQFLIFLIIKRLFQSGKGFRRLADDKLVHHGTEHIQPDF